MNALRFTLTVTGAEAGAPMRWALDLDAFEGAPAGWLDLDTWALTDGGAPLPFRVDGDTLDGRRCVLRFRAPGAGRRRGRRHRVPGGRDPAPAGPAPRAGGPADRRRGGAQPRCHRCHRRPPRGPADRGGRRGLVRPGPA